VANEESATYILRPGDNTGVGTTYASIVPGTGVKAFGPSGLWQDTSRLWDKVPHRAFFQAAPTAGAIAMFLVEEGVWVVNSANIMQLTSGTSPTFDLLWAASGTAAGSGTTQLSAVIAGGTAGNNNKFVLGTLIATPTRAGVGNILWLNIAGTTTNFTGTFSCTTRRVA
jgi:hypothetical protein